MNGRVEMSKRAKAQAGDRLLGWPCRTSDSSMASGGGGTHFSLYPVALNWEGGTLWVVVINPQGIASTHQVVDLVFDPKWKGC